MGGVLINQEVEEESGSIEADRLCVDEEFGEE
jgi:hypothetical protein